MNEKEYLKWQQDARRALSGRYSDDEIDIVLSWFRGIKGQAERDMVGSAEVDAMLVFVSAGKRFDMYNSLMARLFVYAPFILDEAKAEGLVLSEACRAATR